MPRTAKVVPRELPSVSFILDNGASTLKAGFAPPAGTDEAEALTRCHSIPNTLARTRNKRTYVAAQIDKVDDWNEAIFRRPVERGQLVNWEAEKEIWDQSFFHSETAPKDLHIKAPDETTLVLTEGPNTMATLQKNADEIVMEEWGFGGYTRRIGG